MSDRSSLPARIGSDVMSIALAVALLAYGLIRGGGFHVGYIPLVLVLAAVYGWIGRKSLAGGSRGLPSTPGGLARRFLPFVGLLVALALYGELAYDGDETGDRIVVLVGIPLAMGVASLYYSLRADDTPAPHPAPDER